MSLQQELTFSFVFSIFDVRLRAIMMVSGVWVWQRQLEACMHTHQGQVRTWRCSVSIECLLSRITCEYDKYSGWTAEDKRNDLAHSKAIEYLEFVYTLVTQTKVTNAPEGGNNNAAR